MPATIIYARLPVDATQRGDLEKLFGSPAFLLLKELVAARCIVDQVDSMNAALYPESESAKEKQSVTQASAADWNKVLDRLDDLSKGEQEWFTVKLEHNNQ